jgi:hypothetical protein
VRQHIGFWSPGGGIADRSVMPSQRVLVIDNGDLPSAVALFLEGDWSRIVLWHPATTFANAVRRLEVVRAHAEMLGVTEPIVWAPSAAEVPPTVSHALFAAAADAVRLRCGRIVWPVSVDADEQTMRCEVTRAAMVQSLAELDDPVNALRFDLPLIDLTDAQVAEIAMEHSVSAVHAWICDAGGSQWCDECAGCRRWRGAFASHDSHRSSMGRHDGSRDATRLQRGGGGDVRRAASA